MRFWRHLPIVPGPVFVLLALDHSPSFIADSAQFALAGNTMSATFGAVLRPRWRNAIRCGRASRLLLWSGSRARASSQSPAADRATDCAAHDLLGAGDLLRHLTRPLSRGGDAARAVAVCRCRSMRGVFAAMIATAIFVASVYFGASVDRRLCCLSFR